MSSIPLDLQRRFEQRWATRFARPNPPTTPKHQFERQDQELDTLGKAKAVAHRVVKPAGLQICPNSGVSAGAKPSRASPFAAPDVRRNHFRNETRIV